MPAKRKRPAPAKSGFARKLIRWQFKHGRHDLPWQGTRDPYRIWLSEIMLQQTQVVTVIPYYRRFLAHFPDPDSLARATIDDVLKLWSGLGYYSRARNLHAAAQILVGKHGGRFPRTRVEIESLPGIGRSTAAAIAVFAFGAREAILDGNVKRVLARCFAVRGQGTQTERRLWPVAESLLPNQDIEAYTQALMDLGSSLCARSQPDCRRCPVKSDCIAHAQGKTARYPQPRRRKPVPVRSTTMLLLLRHGEILLEKRPPAGIWGGLWCLPEMRLPEDPQHHCERRFGAKLAECTPRPMLRHSFTHFTLNIAPLICRIAEYRKIAAEPGFLWLPLDEAAGAAVPAPVRKLLLACQSAAFEKAL